MLLSNTICDDDLINLSTLAEKCQYWIDNRTDTVAYHIAGSKSSHHLAFNYKQFHQTYYLYGVISLLQNLIEIKYLSSDPRWWFPFYTV